MSNGVGPGCRWRHATPCTLALRAAAGSGLGRAARWDLPPPPAAPPAGLQQGGDGAGASGPYHVLRTRLCLLKRQQAGAGCRKLAQDRSWLLGKPCGLAGTAHQPRTIHAAACTHSQFHRLRPTTSVRCAERLRAPRPLPPLAGPPVDMAHVAEGGAQDGAGLPFPPLGPPPALEEALPAPAAGPQPLRRAPGRPPKCKGCQVCGASLENAKSRFYRVRQGRGGPRLGRRTDVPARRRCRAAARRHAVELCPGPLHLPACCPPAARCTWSAPCRACTPTPSLTTPCCRPPPASSGTGSATST